MKKFQNLLDAFHIRDKFISISNQKIFTYEPFSSSNKLTEKTVKEKFPIGSCMANYENLLLVSGGGDENTNKNVFVFDLNTMKVQKNVILPDMIYGRKHHSCGIVTVNETDVYFIVAGGFNKDGILDSVEVLKVMGDQNATWANIASLKVRKYNEYN